MQLFGFFKTHSQLGPKSTRQYCISSKAPVTGQPGWPMTLTARPGTTLDKEVLQRDKGSMTHDTALHALLHIRTINSVFLLPVHPDYEKWSQHTSISGNTQAAGTLECWR